jgi:hypothetical protein
LQQSVGRLISFSDPVHDFVRLGGILQLDANGAVNAQGFDSLKIRREIDNTSTWGQVPVDPAIAIADMNVNRFSTKS